MRSPEEIQRAHDVLAAYVTQQIEPTEDADDETMLGVTAALDTLCWVLEHDHVQNFEANLERIREWATGVGWSRRVH